jgi:hypothetical protein
VLLLVAIVFLAGDFVEGLFASDDGPLPSELQPELPKTTNARTTPNSNAKLKVSIARPLVAPAGFSWPGRFVCACRMISSPVG